ncbi:MAG: DegV family protein, partial [Planctomycetota bacterium]
ARSRRTGAERMMREMKGKLDGRPAHIAVMHVYAEEAARELEERIAAEFNCDELWVTEFSPLMGYVCGTGTLGVAFYASQGSSPDSRTTPDLSLASSKTIPMPL